MTRRGGAYRLVIALCALPLLAACATSGQDETSAIPKQFRASQILVTLPSATPEQWAATGQAIAREYALQPAGEFPLASLGVQCLVYRVPAERSVAEVLAQLNADSRVALAQSNQVFRTKAASANDPYGPLQYGMNQIHAIAAHAVSTGKGVTIAVIDTGAQVDHPDLSGAVQSENFVEGGERSFQTDRHGTAVAGLIAARAGNGIGIVGVAPDAQVLVSKACWYPSAREDQALCSSWTLAKSVDYVVQRGVRIINLSLVGPDDALLRQLLDTALKRGVIVVAAADQGERTGIPGGPSRCHRGHCQRRAGPCGMAVLGGVETTGGGARAGDSEHRAEHGLRLSVGQFAGGRPGQRGGGLAVAAKTIPVGGRGAGGVGSGQSVAWWP